MEEVSGGVASNESRPIDVRWLLGLLIAALATVVVIHIYTEEEGIRTYAVRAIELKVDSLSQIVPVNDSLVQPILYSQIPGLEGVHTEQAKTLFVSALLPSILIVKHSLEQEMAKLHHLLQKERWTAKDSAFYEAQRQRYNASNPENLLTRMITLPNSIVLAQAAVETGWGRSRFFLEANNVFGIWSYNPAEPRVRAGSMRDSVEIYVRAYDNLAQSIHDYFRTLGSARAYRGLRRARLDTNDPLRLLPYLGRYSERGTDYIRQLR
ncbi:MAG TPA: glucosaminidase domain-containing protein, partial [Cyclobacteriaceae bacterium]|nr:glucosaminidase domain-containing protein [Cyclobacteriaceae bacterium]